MKITEDKSIHRTIHKAKGAEFDDVLLILNNENDLNFLLEPNLANEEHRINYVAVSRAKEHLFICVPTLSPGKENQAIRIFGEGNIIKLDVEGGEL